MSDDVNNFGNQAMIHGVTVAIGGLCTAFKLRLPSEKALLLRIIDNAGYLYSPGDASTAYEAMIESAKVHRAMLFEDLEYEFSLRSGLAQAIDGLKIAFGLKKETTDCQLMWLLCDAAQSERLRAVKDGDAAVRLRNELVRQGPAFMIDKIMRDQEQSILKDYEADDMSFIFVTREAHRTISERMNEVIRIGTAKR
jgi:hypothetical protein